MECTVIAVDHKPLVKIFGNRKLEDIQNARIRNLKEKTRFRVVHIPGVKNRVADTLSWHPTGEKTGPPMHLQDMDSVACHQSPLSIPTLLFHGSPILQETELEMEDTLLPRRCYHCVYSDHLDRRPGSYHGMPLPAAADGSGRGRFP